MKDSEIVDIMRIARPDIVNSTINKYVGQIKSLHRKYYNINEPPRGESDKYEIDNLDFIQDYDKVVDVISHLAFRTQGGFATAVLSVLSSAGDWDTIKKYGELVQNSNKKKNENEKNDIVSDNKKEKYNVNFEDVYSLIEQLKKDNLFKEALMISLMYHFHFRNEISIIQKISLKTYNKLPNDMKKENYLVIGSRALFISRGMYKTASTFGIVKTDIKDRQLKKDILYYTINVPDGGYIFTQESGEPYTNSHISTLIYRITEKEKYLGVGLGTNAINNLFMSSLDNETIQQLKQASINRGTSINTLIKTYHNVV